MLKKNEKVDFGFKIVSQQEKKILVNNVFNKVSPKYDLMNDLASFGLHRYWKNELINGRKNKLDEQTNERMKERRIK